MAQAELRLAQNHLHAGHGHGIPDDLALQLCRGLVETFAQNGLERLVFVRPGLRVQFNKDGPEDFVGFFDLCQALLGDLLRAPLGSGCLLGSNQSEGSADHAAYQGQEHEAGRRHGPAVPAHELTQPVARPRRSRQDRFFPQIALDVCRQGAGGFIAPVAVFFQCLHGNPVQVTLDQLRQLGGFHVPLRRD